MKSLHRLAQWARSRVLPKSSLAKACDYLMSQWEPLVSHLHYGETRLDNNLVENAIRPSCIGKKNWLFIGHPDAGQRSAILYSLIVSCERHGKGPSGVPEGHPHPVAPDDQPGRPRRPHARKLATGPLKLMVTMGACPIVTLGSH